MYVKQKELLENLDHQFIKELIDIAEHETKGKGETIFFEGASADSIYILIKGCVKLYIGELEHPVYIANHPGEIFGWSSIVGRKTYSASAKCLEPAILRKINKDRLFELLHKDEHNGMLFYKKLTESMGNRLLCSYSLATQYVYPRLQGTGQLAEPADVVTL